MLLGSGGGGSWPGWVLCWGGGGVVCLRFGLLWFGGLGCGCCFVLAASVPLQSLDLLSTSRKIRGSVRETGFRSNTELFKQ